MIIFEGTSKDDMIRALCEKLNTLPEDELRDFCMLAKGIIIGQNLLPAAEQKSA